MNNIDPNALAQFELFQGLPEPDLCALAQLFRQKNFRTGTTIVSVEQPGEVVYVIVAGTVKVFVEQENGTDVIVAILGPGDILGEMSLFKTSSRCASALAIESVGTLWIDRRSLYEQLLNVPRLTLNLASVLADRLRLADAQIQALASLDVECRVAKQLLAFADHYGCCADDGTTLIPIRLTQSDLAAMIGASRERTNRVVVSYKERKYISIDPNYHISILNRPALERRVQ